VYAGLKIYTSDWLKLKNLKSFYSLLYDPLHLHDPCRLRPFFRIQLQEELIRVSVRVSIYESLDHVRRISCLVPRVQQLPDRLWQYHIIPELYHSRSQFLILK
jgi:hypothetical protein